MTTQLRAVFRAYWACRNSAYEIAIPINNARIAITAEALKSGWTNEQLADLNREAKREVLG